MLEDVGAVHAKGSAASKSSCGLLRQDFDAEAGGRGRAVFGCYFSVVSGRRVRPDECGLWQRMSVDVTTTSGLSAGRCNSIPSPAWKALGRSRSQLR